MWHAHQPESWCVTGVNRYDQSRDVGRNREVRLESGYTIGVMSSNQSRAYDQSHIFRPESRNTGIISMYIR
jgi:hypothetical protein